MIAHDILDGLAKTNPAGFLLVYRALCSSLALVADKMGQDTARAMAGEGWAQHEAEGTTGTWWQQTLRPGGYWDEPKTVTLSVFRSGGFIFDTQYHGFPGTPGYHAGLIPGGLLADMEPIRLMFEAPRAEPARVRVEEPEDRSPQEFHALIVGERDEEEDARLTPEDESAGVGIDRQEAPPGTGCGAENHGLFMRSSGFRDGDACPVCGWRVYLRPGGVIMSISIPVDPDGD